jgi:hypothetical protein
VGTQYAQLTCRSGNIGDEFQSLAARQHLPQQPKFYIDRDTLHRWHEPRVSAAVMIMNGWFSGNAEAWPPSPTILPIFVGFHVTDRFKESIRTHVDYLRRFEPIGVRDEATGAFLRSLGVQTETTYCLTLTFPTRPSAPKAGKVYIVDAENIAIPRTLRKNAIKMSHMVPPLDQRATVPFARHLLDMYRDTAALVITTRLHAALPCIAMGIPVVFFGDPSDERTAIVRKIGGIIYDIRLHKKIMWRGMLGRAFNEVDWSPALLNVSHFKDALATAVARRIGAIQERFSRTVDRDRASC